MTARSCRFCSSSAGELRPVSVDAGALRGPGGARARRMARIPVLEHAACLEAHEAAHELADAIRRELNLAGSQAAREGRLADAIALADAAVDVLDSHYLEVVR